MKNLFYKLFIMILSLIFYSLKGQRIPSIESQNNQILSLERQKSFEIGFLDSQMLGSYKIAVGYIKTVNLIFPAPLHAVDLGSGDIVADKFDEVDNILRIKSLENRPFPETNISAVTKDGKYYSFIVNYSKNPEILSYQLRGNDFSGSTKTWFDPDQEYRGTSAVTFENIEMNQSLLYKHLMDVLKKPSFINHLGARKFDLNIAIDGVYIKNNVIFITLSFKNKSHIEFEVDFIRFYVKDKKLSKRTSFQEIDLDPIFTYPKFSKIAGKKQIRFGFAFQKFTIPDGKIIEVELLEKKGGRHLRFNLDYDDIINAKLIKK